MHRGSNPHRTIMETKPNEIEFRRIIGDIIDHLSDSRLELNLETGQSNTYFYLKIKLTTNGTITTSAVNFSPEFVRRYGNREGEVWKEVSKFMSQHWIRSEVKWSKLTK